MRHFPDGAGRCAGWTGTSAHGATAICRPWSTCSPATRYRASPYEESEVGHEAIKAFWLEDEGETFTMEAIPVAVEEATAVVRVLVRYGDPVRQEYLDLWVMHFTDDGRVDDFEEWAYWPGKSFSASAD